MSEDIKNSLKGVREAVEILSMRDDLGKGPDGLEELAAHWERERSALLRRLDRMTANQRELDARLWTIEDSRAFRILQRVGIALGWFHQRVRKTISPGSDGRERDRQYQHWLEREARSQVDTNRFSYQPRFRILSVADGSAVDLNRAAREPASDYLVFVNSGCELAPNGLAHITAELQHERFEALYGDEDHLTASGARHNPVFKPEWSPELVFSTRYLGQLLVVSAAAFQAVGGFREGFAEACLFDLALRLTEQGLRFHRVPQVLVSARNQAVSSAAEKLALEESVARRGLAADVEKSGKGFVLKRKVQGAPLVSIVICSRRAELLQDCLDAIESKTGYAHREIVVVEHLTEDSRKLDRLLSRSSCRRVRYSGAFDFATMNNLGAKAAEGQILLFLNDDAQPLESTWLEAMVAQAQRPEVGVVGALLLFPSGAIQHTGVVLGISGAAGHPCRGTADGGFWSWAWDTRNVSAVTGACLAIRRDLFEELGGFDTRFAVDYNDIDLCLRAGKVGYQVILEASARLRHFESSTRPRGVQWEERELFAERWGSLIASGDPYYSPHLTLRSEDCSLAWE